VEFTVRLALLLALAFRSWQSVMEPIGSSSVAAASLTDFSQLRSKTRPPVGALFYFPWARPTWRATMHPAAFLALYRRRLAAATTGFGAASRARQH